MAASSKSEASATARQTITTSMRCGTCGQTVHAELLSSKSTVTCPRCNSTYELAHSLNQLNSLEKCPHCGCDELFWRKDFPQRLGVTIVVLGFAISCVTWYFHMLIATFAVLLATALIDFALFMFVGDVLECYRCHAQFRGCASGERHGGFDLETHEKHRQIMARKMPSKSPSP